MIRTKYTTRDFPLARRRQRWSNLLQTSRKYYNISKDAPTLEATLRTRSTLASLEMPRN